MDALEHEGPLPSPAATTGAARSSSPARIRPPRASSNDFGQVSSVRQTMPTLRQFTDPAHDQRPVAIAAARSQPIGTVIDGSSFMTRIWRQLETFLSRDDQEREWFLEMLQRLSTVGPKVMGGFGVVIVLSAPWLGINFVALFVVAGLSLGLGRGLAKRIRRSEPIVVGWFVAQTLFAVAIASTGRVENGYLGILIVGIIAASAAFPDRLVAVCTGYTVILMIVVGLGLDAAAITRQPPVLLIPIGILLAVTAAATAIRQSSVENRGAALIDPLTGMLNRMALRIRTAELSHLSALTGRPVAVLALDIDLFKSINDRFGHPIGDRVLAGFAYKVREGLRAYDLAYRMGGEEFVILLPDASLVDATDLAERLRAAIAAGRIAEVPVTVSIGVATSRRGQAFDFEETFRRADAALYEAKHGGRDCVRSDPVSLEDATGTLGPLTDGLQESLGRQLA